MIFPPIGKWRVKVGNDELFHTELKVLQSLIEKCGKLGEVYVFICDEPRTGEFPFRLVREIHICSFCGCIKRTSKEWVSLDVPADANGIVIIHKVLPCANPLCRNYQDYVKSTYRRYGKCDVCHNTSLRGQPCEIHGGSPLPPAVMSFSEWVLSKGGARVSQYPLLKSLKFELDPTWIIRDNLSIYDIPHGVDPVYLKPNEIELVRRQMEVEMLEEDRKQA